MGMPNWRLGGPHSKLFLNYCVIRVYCAFKFIYLKLYWLYFGTRVHLIVIPNQNKNLFKNAGARRPKRLTHWLEKTWKSEKMVSLSHAWHFQPSKIATVHTFIEAFSSKASVPLFLAPEFSSTLDSYFERESWRNSHKANRTRQLSLVSRLLSIFSIHLKSVICEYFQSTTPCMKQ